MNVKNKIELYTTSDNQTKLLVQFEKETVWLTQGQITDLFERDRTVITKHINNIFKEGELEKESNVQKMHIPNSDKPVAFYNLDVIISVGYRVKSKRGTQFRQWASKRLKDYLIKGYAVNEELLQKQQQSLIELKHQIDLLNQNALDERKVLTDGFLAIISKYSRSFELLSKYDSDELSTENLNKNIIYTINYKDVKNGIAGLKKELTDKGEARELFGNEKDDSFKGILGSISQTVFGDLAYPTVEEQAAQLLYSIIKGHAFSDGNKRIGSFVFVWFLEQNNFQLDGKGQQKINHNTLVALALTVAQSLPAQRSTILKLIINLIKN